MNRNTAALFLVCVGLLAALESFAQTASSTLSTPPVPGTPATAATPGTPGTSPTPGAPGAPATPPEPATYPTQNVNPLVVPMPEPVGGTPDAVPSRPAAATGSAPAAPREDLQSLLYDMYKKEAWLALSKDEREKVVREILPTMTFNGIPEDALDEAAVRVNECTGTELGTGEYADYDVATAITKCLFKLGYAP